MSARFFPGRRWLKRRGGRRTWRRRRRSRSKRRKNNSAGGRRWFCRRFLAAGKQHIILNVSGACLGASLVIRVFAYALPTFRLRGAYAGELLRFRILAMQTSRLETLQKRERNSSISFCFSAKQLPSSNYNNYLCFVDSGNFSLDPSILTHRLQNSSNPRRLRGVCRKMKQNMPTPAYAPQQTAYIQPCAGQFSYKSLFVKKNSAHTAIVFLSNNMSIVHDLCRTSSGLVKYSSWSTELSCVSVICVEHRIASYWAEKMPWQQYQ